MSDFLQRLFKIAGTNNQSEIARKLNVPPTTLSNWISRGVSKGGALKISQTYNVSVEYVLTGKGEMTARPTIDELRQKMGEIQGRTDGVERANPVKMLPVINEVQAGYFTDIGDDAFDEYEPAHHKDGDYWLRVKGDSMMPDFHPGDLILVGKDRVAVTGNYVVALVADDAKATFKKYRECFDDGKVYHQLIAINDFYPIIDSRAKAFEVIGVVLEHKRVLA